MKFTVRGMLALAIGGAKLGEHSLVIAGDILCGDHDDVVVGQEVERRRVLRAGDHDGGAALGDAAEGVADRIEIAAVAAALRHLKCGLAPRHRLEPWIVAHPQRRGQIVIAQELGDRARHLRDRESTTRTVASAASACARKTSTRASPETWPRAGITPFGARSSRSATICRRVRSSPLTASERRMLEKMSVRAVVMRRARRRAHASSAPGRSCLAAPESRGDCVQPRLARSHLKRPPRAAEPSKRPDAYSRRKPVERRPPGEKPPQPDAGADRRWGEMALELALTPMAHHLGQRDADRANALATSAESRSIGKMSSLVDADQRWCQHRTHRSRIDPSIGMTSDCLINRAVIHARPTSNTSQHVLKTGAEHGGAAVVEDDDVVALGAVDVARAARAGRERRVDRHVLPGRRAGEHAQELRRVLERRHELLDRGEDDMRLRQDLRQIAVALVRDDDRGAGLGDEEIRPGDADIGGEEPLAQHGARLAEELHRLGQVAPRVERLVHPPEVLLDLRRGDVHRGRDDVRGHLAAELDDVLAEVGLDRRDAARLEMGVQPDLLGDHRLALGDGAGAGRAADRQDDLPRLFRSAGEMHLAARRQDLRLVFLEVEVEMGERVVLDVARRVAQRLELRQRGGGGGALVDEAALDLGERRLQRRVGKRPGGVLLEPGRGGDDGHGRRCPARERALWPSIARKARAGPADAPPLPEGEVELRRRARPGEGLRLSGESPVRRRRACPWYPSRLPRRAHGPEFFGGIAKSRTGRRPAAFGGRRSLTGDPTETRSFHALDGEVRPVRAG